MPRLTALPDMATIEKLKGTLDFYLWKGLPVARAWPRRPRLPLDSPLWDTANEFGRYTKAVAATASALKTTWSSQTTNTGWSWRDAATSAAYGNANKDA